MLALPAGGALGLATAEEAPILRVLAAALLRAARGSRAAVGHSTAMRLLGSREGSTSTGVQSQPAPAAARPQAGPAAQQAQRCQQALQEGPAASRPGAVRSPASAADGAGCTVRSMECSSISSLAANTTSPEPAGWRGPGRVQRCATLRCHRWRSMRAAGRGGREGAGQPVCRGRGSRGPCRSCCASCCWPRAPNWRCLPLPHPGG